jgi:sugar lactone lactonase YvrE
LNFPGALAVDQSGNLYIGDLGNDVVRRVSASGTIESILPPREPLTALTVDRFGNLVIAFGIQVYYWIPSSTPPGFPIVGGSHIGRDSVPAASSLLFGPTGVAGDAALNLYIAEPETRRIRVVDRSGIIRTFSGNSGEYFSGDGGRAADAGLGFPEGVAADWKGVVWIADTGNNRIRRVTTDGIIHTVAGNGKFGSAGDGGPAVEAELTVPRYIAIDSADNLFLTDSINNRIRQVTLDGMIRTIAGTGQRGLTGDDGSATSGQLSAPLALAVDGNGNLYFLDQAGERVRRVNAEGVLTTVVETRNARGIAVDPSGRIVICDDDTIGRISDDGSIERIAGSDVPGYSGDGGDALSAQFNGLAGMWIDQAGAIYVVDSGNHRIRKLTPMAP